MMTQPTPWLYCAKTVIPSAEDDNRLVITPALIQYGSNIEQVITTQGEIDSISRQLDPTELTTLPEHTLLTPAFINAHTHLPMNCFRALGVNNATEHNVVEDLFFHVESRMTAEDVAAFATVGAYESLLHGVGLVWDHYYSGDVLAEAIAQTPLSAVVAPTLQDLAGPGQPSCGAQWDATMSMLASPTDNIWVALGPHATDTVSPALWEKITQAAVDHQVPIHAHVAQSVDEWTRAWDRHGTSPVGMLKKFGVLDAPTPFALIHAIYLSDDDFTLLDPERHTLGFCPYSQLIFEFPADVFAWHTNNMPWFVATDCAASNDSMNVQKEMRYVAGMRINPTTSSEAYQRFQRTNTREDALASHKARHTLYEQREAFADEQLLLSRVWDVPGAMHPGFDAGVLRQGALANMVVWDLDHPAFWPAQNPLRTLAMGDTTQAIHHMMVGGHWVGEAGDFHRSLRWSDEYQRARAHADTRLRPFL